LICGIIVSSKNHESGQSVRKIVNLREFAVFLFLAREKIKNTSKKTEKEREV